MRVEKPSSVAFFKYFKFRKFKKRQRPCTFVTVLRGSTIAIITPMRQARTRGRVRALGSTPSAPKQWKLDVHVQRAHPVSARSQPTKSKKEQIIESSAI